MPFARTPAAPLTPSQGVGLSCGAACRCAPATWPVGRPFRSCSPMYLPFHWSNPRAALVDRTLRPPCEARCRSVGQIVSQTHNGRPLALLAPPHCRCTGRTAPEPGPTRGWRWVRGRIVKRESHSKLLGARGLYVDLHRMQVARSGEEAAGWHPLGP